jgi:polysaccharide deacetylase 2 family uncharacterized protein YibQ
MGRRYDDDEDVRPNWLWRLVKGIVAGGVASAAALAVLSIYVLPPPAPPPAPETAGAGEPQVVDGIEVANRPAYFGAATAGAPAEAEAAGPIALEGPALAVNAVPFEADPAVPLVAVVLDDAAANPLLHEALFAMDMPLTVGVVAGADGDQATARAARDAGYEVVAELPLAAPGAGSGAGLEYGLAREEAAERTMLLMRRLPMAVAAARPLAAPAAPDPGVLAGLLEAIGTMGFAWLEHGLLPGMQPAVASDGVERIVAVSRFTIPSGAPATDAYAILDMAAAAAAEDGGAAVVLAPTEEQVLLALQLWAGAGAGGMAQIAPLSAVIRRQNGGDAAAPDTVEAAPVAVTEPAAQPASAAGASN